MGDPTAETRDEKKRLPAVAIVSASADFTDACRDAIEPYPVVRFPSVAAAAEALPALKPKVVVVDERLPGREGISLLEDVVIAVGAQLVDALTREQVCTRLRFALATA